MQTFKKLPIHNPNIKIVIKQMSILTLSYWKIVCISYEPAGLVTEPVDQPVAAV